MLMFWGFAAAMLMVVLAFLLPPLLHSACAVTMDSTDEKLAIYRRQFDELEQDKSSGMLDAQQFSIAKGELERRMLEENSIAVASKSKSLVTTDRRLAAGLLLGIPVVAVLLYLRLGNPAAMMPMTAMAGARAHQMAQEMAPLLESLRKKLETHPDNGAGWALLGRSYMHFGQPEAAVDAYDKAARLLPNDAQLLADYADALATVNGNSLVGRPEKLARQALGIDPHQPRALMLAATAAFDRKDYAESVRYWERAQQALPAGSPMATDVAAALGEARALANK